MQLDSASSAAMAESEARRLISVFSPWSTWSSSSCSSTVTFSTDLATKVCRAAWAAGGRTSLTGILLKGLLEDLLKGGGLPVGVPLLMALDNMVWGEDFRPAAADDITEGGVVFLAPIAAVDDDDDDGGVGLILLWCNK